MIVTGYPVRGFSASSILFRPPAFAQLQEIAASITGDIVAVVGYLDQGPKNAVAVYSMKEKSKPDT